MLKKLSVLANTLDSAGGSPGKPVANPPPEPETPMPRGSANDGVSLASSPCICGQLSHGPDWSLVPTKVANPNLLSMAGGAVNVSINSIPYDAANTGLYQPGKQTAHSTAIHVVVIGVLTRLSMRIPS